MTVHDVASFNFLPLPDTFHYHATYIFSYNQYTPSTPPNCGS